MAEHPGSSNREMSKVNPARIAQKLSLLIRLGKCRPWSARTLLAVAQHPVFVYLPVTFSFDNRCAREHWVICSLSGIRWIFHYQTSPWSFIKLATTHKTRFCDAAISIVSQRIPRDSTPITHKTWGTGKVRFTRDIRRLRSLTTRSEPLRTTPSLEFSSIFVPR